MLREIKHVKQQADGPRKRWFNDYEMDLVIWHEDDVIVGIQLCYDRLQDEKALTWSNARGFFHDAVDSGESLPGKPKMSPTLSPMAGFDGERLKRQFLLLSTDIDHDVCAFVVQLIDQMSDAS